MQALPIDSYLEKVATSYRENDNLILCAPPGTGKTTRIPFYLLKTYKKIVVLVPKRIAAASAAARVCEENSLTLGEEVGFQVRFENKTTSKTRLIYMTQGVFLKKIPDENFWLDLDLVIFDEFHERTSALDMALGICLEKQILHNSRNTKTKILVMSATLNAEKISEFLLACPIIQVQTPVYPLQIIKNKRAQKLKFDLSFVKELTEILKLATKHAKKDILIFLPGMSEIRFAQRELDPLFPNYVFSILHSSISLEEQKKILGFSTQKRVILSTNIAESSITLPNVDCVIDSGLEKKSRKENKIGFSRLETCRISLFSAKQRAGRAARTSEGVCYQMWHESDERSMEEQITPEVLTSSLFEECLTLFNCGINPKQFSWLDKPQQNFESVFQSLQLWNLVNLNYEITSKGKLTQLCPLDIEASTLFIELSELGYQSEISSLLAFLESTNFSLLTETPNLEQIITEQAPTFLQKRILEQLLNLKVPHKDLKKQHDFRFNLISCFFRLFPHKIAQYKENNLAISSLGRGLELSSNLINPKFSYYILLNGFDLSNALTKCDFAIGFTDSEFKAHASESIMSTQIIEYDNKNRRLYKIDRKSVGIFIISETTKEFINETVEKDILLNFLKHNFNLVLNEHPDYAEFIKKINFLKKFQDQLGYKTEDWNFFEDISNQLCENVCPFITTIENFLKEPLISYLYALCPEKIKHDLNSLPEFLKLPKGKMLKIDYEHEQAPLVSARIQEFLGLKKTPALTFTKNQIPLTIELLAPNYRPAQITKDLENFWKHSYFELRKEFRARYPKHAWPENPLDYKTE